jgi:hypothetical protein
MTQNMDEGTDFGLLASATTPAQFVAAVTATYQEVQASNIPERAAGVAAEIAVARPTLVALQEVSLWRTGSPGSPGSPLSVTLTSDFLYIGDASNNTIKQFDASTGAYLRKCIAPGAQLQGPQGILHLSNGNFLVANQRVSQGTFPESRQAMQRLGHFLDRQVAAQGPAPATRRSGTP